MPVTSAVALLRTGQLQHSGPEEDQVQRGDRPWLERHRLSPEPFSLSVKHKSEVNLFPYVSSCLTYRRKHQEAKPGDYVTAVSMVGM